MSAQQQATNNTSANRPQDPGRDQQPRVATVQILLNPDPPTSSMVEYVTQTVNRYGAALVKVPAWKQALNEVTQKTEAAYRRGIQETEAACKRKNDETEANCKRKIEENEAAFQRKIKESEAAMKRKIKETIQCTVCLTVPRKGYTLQCQNGHLFCDRCNTDGSCPYCREPLGQLGGNKRIRALVSQQIIEAVAIEFECEHTDCEFEAPKDKIASHMKKCTYRKVACPDACCREYVPLRNLLEHMEHGRDVLECNIDGLIVEGFLMSTTYYNRKYETSDWDGRVFTFQDKHFVMVLTRIDRLYHSYLYILADIEEAKNYTVTITAGYGGQTEKIHRGGQVFPIDAKQKDILKQRNGVLSFERGSGDLFEDQEHVPGLEKKVVLCFKVNRVES